MSVQRSSAILLGAVLASASLGCRTECVADEKATREQLDREQKAVLRGQGVCLALLRPKLSVVDDRVLLKAAKENVLARRTDLPLNEVSDFGPLHQRLSGYRTHFKAVRGADPFEPTLEVDLDPALEPVRAATLLATAAAAGFSRSAVHAGDVELDLEWWTAPADDRTTRALCVEPRADGYAVTLYDEMQSAPTAHSAVPREGLAPEFTRLCAGRTPCADVIGVVEREGETLVDVARNLRATLSAAPFAAKAVIVTRAPIATPPSDAGTAMKASRFARRPCNAP